MFIDSHVHVDRDDPDADPHALVARANAAGVSQLVVIGGSEGLNAGALSTAETCSGCTRAVLGYGRDRAPELTVNGAIKAEAMVALEAQLCAASARVAGVGEIGLDYHYTPQTAPQQRALFTAQLQMARRLDLPVVVHSREADADTLALLGPFAAPEGAGPRGRGVLHCFTGDAAFADALVALGFWISFSGILTFRNADALRAVAKRVPPERLLIETDTPYLAPVPMRGKRNEPAFLRHVAEQLSDVRGWSLAKTAEITSANARELFRLP